MKKIITRFCLMLFLGVSLVSCSIFDNPNHFSDNITPFTTIIFKLNPNGADDMNYTGTGTPSVPNGGTATQTTAFRPACNAQIYAKLTAATKEVQVYRLNTTTGARELKTTLAVSGDLAYLNVPVASLTLASAVPTSGQVVLQFVAVANDGATTSRNFTFNVAATGPACP